MRDSVFLFISAGVLFLGGAGIPAWADGETAVWTYRGDFDQAIPADPEATAGWMEAAIIEVPDHLIIEDLDVGVTVTHTNASDLQIFLTSPSGTTVLLSSFDPLDGFLVGEDYQGTVFDDEAALSIADGVPPFDGAFQPVGPEGLAVFDGEDAFGVWELAIYDAYYLDTGSLNSVILTITTPEPSAVLVLLAGLGAVRSIGRRRRR